MKPNMFVYVFTIFLIYLTVAMADETKDKDALLNEIIAGYYKNMNFFQSGTINLQNHIIDKKSRTKSKELKVQFNGINVRNENRTKQYEDTYQVDDTLPESPASQQIDHIIFDGKRYFDSSPHGSSITIDDAANINMYTNHILYLPFYYGFRIIEYPLDTYIKNNKQIIAVSKKGTLIKFDVAFDSSRIQQTWIDPNRGYLVVKIHFEVPSGYYELNIEPQEVSPGFWYPKKIEIKESFSQLRQITSWLGGFGESWVLSHKTQNITITDYEFNIPIEDDQFHLNSLLNKTSNTIYDYRYNPSVLYQIESQKLSCEEHEKIYNE